MALELWVHATGVASNPSFSPHKSCLVTTGIERRGKKKQHLSPSTHSLRRLPTPGGERWRGLPSKGSPLAASKTCATGPLLGKLHAGLGRWDVHIQEKQQSLAAPAELIGNDVPAASFCTAHTARTAHAACTAHTAHAAYTVCGRAGTTHPLLLRHPGEAGAAPIGRVPSSDSTCLTCQGAYFGTERSGG